MRHELINPEGLAPPAGYTHVVRPGEGRLVFLAGQTAHQADGTVAGATLAQQFEHALRNVVTALEAADAGPEDLVWLQVFTTDIDAYRDSLAEVGAAWRAVLGRHFPAMSLFGVSALVDPAASVELVGIAVVPGR